MNQSMSCMTSACVLAMLLPSPSLAQEEPTWEYDLKLYGWYAWFDGSTGAEGEPPVESDSSLVDLLDGFFLVQGEARRDKISLLGEFNWVKLSDGFGRSVGTLSADWELDGKMVALGAGYAVYEEAGTRIELTGGLRYWDVGVETDILGKSAQADTTLVDPFVGARFEMPLNDRMMLKASTSYGVWGDSDSQFDVAAEVRWSWTPRVDLALGARYLTLDMDKDSVLVDATLYGPYAAVSFRF